MSEPPDANKYALTQTYEVWKYFVKTRATNRILFWTTEIAILIISASITAVGILFPANARPAVILGAIVLVMSGLCQLFHFRENWARHAATHIALNGKMRLFKIGASPCRRGGGVGISKPKRGLDAGCR